MLTDLLNAADITFDTSQNGFTLDGSYYTVNPYLIGYDPFIYRDIASNYTFTLISWDAFKRRLVVPVEFAFVAGGDHLVMVTNDVRTICDANGVPLKGVICASRDRRIINRLRATELLK